MGKVIIRDLKNKLHTFELSDGTIIRIYADKTATIDENLLTKVIKDEANAGLLAISPVPVGNNQPKIVVDKNINNSGETGKSSNNKQSK